MRELIGLLKDPSGFFEGVREEDWRPAFRFFLEVTLALSVITPVVNYFGIESTDFSSAYQAQIMAYKLVKNTLLPQYGAYAYLMEPILIVGFACIILVFGTGFLHLVYKLMGGKGPVSNAWKAMCYGLGPCVLGGFLPYISLLVAFYAVILQIYVGPKVLYDVRESRAMFLLALTIALTFIEMFLTGTTVGFFD